nr:Tubulin glycylase [Ipomoea batatas]
MEAFKEMKVEVNQATTEPEMASPVAATGGLARQGSMNKNSCLCSPTTHAGSFRCRLHRAPATPGPALHRTKSVESKPNSNENQTGSG